MLGLRTEARPSAFIDPTVDFTNANPSSSNFCCDQVVSYISQVDTFVWLMQYGPETGDNIRRFAFASTTGVVEDRCRLFDITTHSLNEDVMNSEPRWKEEQ